MIYESPYASPLEPAVVESCGKIEYRKKHSRWPRSGPRRSAAHEIARCPYRVSPARAHRADAVRMPLAAESPSFIQSMRSEIVVPLSFVPEVRPGKLVPTSICATTRSGRHALAWRRWAERSASAELSPLSSRAARFGPPTRSCHLCVRSSNTREVRDDSLAKGIWPPPVGRRPPLTMETISYARGIFAAAYDLVATRARAAMACSRAA